MSYILKFWEPQAQTTSAEVDAVVRLLARLDSTHPGQNPLFIALAERLTRRFPCITSPEIESIPQAQWAWSDGPLDGKTDTAVYAIGLQARMLEQVRPFVIEQANALGLGVLDTQAGQAYLPGEVVSPSGLLAPSPEPALAVAHSTDQLEGMLFAALGSLLAPYGYKPRKSDLSFRKKFRGGWHLLSLAPQESGGGIEFASFIDTRLDSLVDLYFKAIPPDRPGLDTSRRASTTLHQWQWMRRSGDAGQGGFHTYRLGDLADLERAVAHFGVQWKEFVQPLLEQLETVEGMDRVLNTQPLQDSVLFWNFNNITTNILAAYLARSARLDALCDEALAGVKSTELLERLRKCVQYVRANPLN